LSLCKHGWHPLLDMLKISNYNEMKTNNQKNRKSKLKNSTDESTESEKRRRLLSMQGKVKWEGDLDEMRRSRG